VWRRRITGRLRRSGASRLARRLVRRTSALLSPSARSEARATALPRRLRWLRVGSIGPVGEPLGSYVVRDLLRRPLGPGDRPLDLVLVAGSSTGGPDRLAGPVVDALIACERRGVPTVLVATTATDLETDVAAVCWEVACTDAATAAAAGRSAGGERTHLVSVDGAPHSGRIAALLAMLDE